MTESEKQLIKEIKNSFEERIQEYQNYLDKHYKEDMAEWEVKTEDQREFVEEQIAAYKSEVDEFCKKHIEEPESRIVYKKRCAKKLKEGIEWEIAAYKNELYTFLKRYIKQPETLTREYAKFVTNKWINLQIIDNKQAELIKQMILTKIKKMDRGENE